MASLLSVFGDQRGDAAIQYALVASLLGLAVLAGSLALREPVVELYADVGAKTDQVFAVEPAAGREDKVMGEGPGRGAAPFTPRSR